MGTGAGLWGIRALLPERMQADVAYRTVTMENITPAVLKEIEEALEVCLFLNKPMIGLIALAVTQEGVALAQTGRVIWAATRTD